MSALVLTCAPGVVASAHAAEPPTSEARRDAKSLADQGADAYSRGSFARALELFVRAYALVPAPTIALFEARTLVRLGRLVEARNAYARASTTPLSSDDPPAFREAARDAEAELAALERRIPRYRVIVERAAGGAAPAAIALDGRPLSASSLGTWLPADPGTHELGFTDQNGEPHVARFELRESETKTVRVDVAGSSSPMRTLGFVSLGVGAAGLVLGVSAGAVALDAHRDAERGCPDETCVRGSPGADALERFEDYRTLSTVGYVVGAVGAATGVALILGTAGESKPRVALRSSLRDVKLEARF